MKNKYDLISVIMPVYNGEKYIEKAIVGLINQTYSNLEIIVIDDGSIDNTVNICDYYSDAYENIIVVHTKNNGVSSARNKGLELANGRYISFVDVDDYVFPCYIEYLYSLICRHNADISMGRCYKLNEKESIPKRFFEDNDLTLEQNFTSSEALENLLYRRGITGYPCLKLVRKEILNKIRFIEGISYGEDFVFSFQILENAEKIVLGNKIIYIYYQHENSANHSPVVVNKYKYSWEGFEKYVYEEIIDKHGSLYNALNAKSMVFALDFCCRLNGVKDGEELYAVLCQKIEGYCKVVSKDTKAKISNRFLAYLCRVDVKLVIRTCILFLNMKRLLGIEVRQQL